MVSCNMFQDSRVPSVAIVAICLVVMSLLSAIEATGELKVVGDLADLGEKDLTNMLDSLDQILENSQGRVMETSQSQS